MFTYRLMPLMQTGAGGEGLLFWGVSGYARGRTMTVKARRRQGLP